MSKTWRLLLGDEYKSRWCVACTGGSNIAGVWANWARSDGLTICGVFHKPEDFPDGQTVEEVVLKRTVQEILARKRALA